MYDNDIWNKSLIIFSLLIQQSINHVYRGKLEFSDVENTPYIEYDGHI